MIPASPLPDGFPWPRMEPAVQAALEQRYAHYQKECPRHPGQELTFVKVFSTQGGDGNYALPMTCMYTCNDFMTVDLYDPDAEPRFK